MPNNDVPRQIYWDACVFIDLLKRRRDRIETLDAIFEHIQSSSKSLLYTSILTITEVAYHAMERDSRVLDPSVLERLDEMWEDSSVVQVIELNSAIAKRARDLVRLGMLNKKCISASDAIHLASAAWIGRIKNLTEFHTYDRDLVEWGEKLRLNDEIGMPICRPTITPYEDPHMSLFSSDNYSGA